MTLDFLRLARVLGERVVTLDNYKQNFFCQNISAYFLSKSTLDLVFDCLKMALRG